MTSATRRHVVVHLGAGGLLIYPTETAYAVGCDATNARAVRALFALKGRPRGKSLPLIVASVAMARRYAWCTPLAHRLVRAYWPGPLTIVVAGRSEAGRSEAGRSEAGRSEAGRSKKSPAGDVLGSPMPAASRLAPGVIARDGTIALRVSAHPIARALARWLGRPIVSTSANRSGEPPCYSVRAALRSLGLPPLREVTAGGEDAVAIMSVVDGATIIALDIGALPRRHPTTIVDARGAHPVVLRHGAMRVVDAPR